LEVMVSGFRVLADVVRRTNGRFCVAADEVGAHNLVVVVDAAGRGPA